MGTRQVATCIALIMACGRGTRFAAPLPKQYAMLAGQPVLRRVLDPFVGHDRIDAVRVVIHPHDRRLYEEAACGLDLLEPVAGGATRQESVQKGLASLLGHEPDYVLIQDGARPMTTRAQIDRVLDALASFDAAIPTLPVADTLKQVDNEVVVATIDRLGVHRAQTPQGFRFKPIFEAHRSARDGQATDDAALAEAAGLRIKAVSGDEMNIKITQPDDLERMERLMMARHLPRTGLGFDVHRLEPGDGLMLLGVKLQDPLRLIGHSDADVGLHAVTDALFGALGDGDIGSHFPPSDPRWEGADSALFLAHAVELVARASGRIVHVDVTLICERPKIGPHRAAMVARLADLLRIDASRVSVKATTTERLGFTGRGEGIAAQAVATVLLPA